MAASRCRRCCGVTWVGLKSFPDGLVEKSAPHPPLRGTFSPRAGRRESRARAPLIRPFGAPSPRARGEGSQEQEQERPSSAPSGHLLPAGGEKGCSWVSL